MSMTATNMMYSGAAINSGSHTSFQSQIDMTCQAINSTHYMCKVVDKVQQPSGVPDSIAIPLALVIAFMLACVMVFFYKSGIK